MNKKIRVVLALLFVIPLVYFYIVPGADEMLMKISHLQMIQLLLMIRGGNFLPFAAILALLLLSVVFFGRIYCSTVCPLGTIQDILIRLRGIAGIKKFRYSRPVRAIPIVFLAVYVLLYILGINILLTLFEPFTNAARILSFFPSRDAAAVTISTATALLLFAAVMFKGRLFCNTLCPAGSVLSVLARFSVYKIGFNRETCISCGSCEWVCKAECVNVKDKTVDFDRCIGCQNCIDACPRKAITWERQEKKTVRTDAKKREFIKTALVSVSLASLPAGLRASAGPGKKGIMMPPGAVNTGRFNSLCTSCHACVKTCPQQVIDISLTEYGVLNIFRPKLDFQKSYCLYKCVSCTEVCPSGALKEMTLQEKKRLSMGKAQLDKKKCIGYTKGRTCNVCVEHCPVKAVYAVKYRDNLAPEVLKEICTGCGACEKTCPVRPEKAITVRALEVHETIPDPARAVRPNEYNLKFGAKKEDTKRDFPF